jgi:hypothetical protein
MTRVTSSSDLSDSYPPGLTVSGCLCLLLRPRRRWPVAASNPKRMAEGSLHSSSRSTPGDRCSAGSARLNYCDEACRGPQRSANPEAPGQNDGFPGTSPITAFPQGQTREGVANLSGNVWEWCLGTSNGESVTLGGSYSATFEECTTDTLSWEPAKLSAPDGGFRCVWH